MTDPSRRGSAQFSFAGRGDQTQLASSLDQIQPWGGRIGPWFRRPGDTGETDPVAQPMHPANYIARPDLVHAVNTSLLLGKPLLLTGGPGTGKSQLAERIAWEFNLGPVLRFDAQSLSEAADLFYRFDLVGYLAAVEMAKSRREPVGLGLPGKPGPADAAPASEPVPPREAFARMGALGQAILRSAPTAYPALFDAVFGPAEFAASAEARPSVVLIDEIDKASRDFPNDLLNAIERMQFDLPELRRLPLFAASAQRPIVIVTSNQERELPAPFLRRCTFFHIDDPTSDELAAIVARRFFAGASGSPPTLPPSFRQLLDVFVQFRARHGDELQYQPGTQELIDWTDVLRQRRLQPDEDLLARLDDALAAAAVVSKHREDQRLLRRFLEGMKPAAA